MTLRWGRCPLQRGASAEQFIEQFFSQKERKALLLAGAGFDPRATRVAELLAPQLLDRLHAVLIREERPNPDPLLIERAEENIRILRETIPQAVPVRVEIFANDGAVIGGREAVRIVAESQPKQFTDVVVDASALSRGIVFPVVRYILSTVTSDINVHLFVTDDPATDLDISTSTWDQPGYIHGFKGDPESANNPDAAKLWLPQLVAGERTALDRIFRFVAPHDVCPILPFPSIDPRASDALIEHFGTELQEVWNVDPRNLVYAHESNPLDLYRAIVRIGDARREIFANTIGSRIVLSPIGSKVLSLGAMMAAIDRDFPVVYVEAVSYRLSVRPSSIARCESPVLHLWLNGEAYEEHKAA
jgi:hypothetical protein